MSSARCLVTKELVKDDREMVVEGGISRFCLEHSKILKSPSRGTICRCLLIAGPRPTLIHRTPSDNAAALAFRWRCAASAKSRGGRRSLPNSSVRDQHGHPGPGNFTTRSAR